MPRSKRIRAALLALVLLVALPFAGELWARLRFGYGNPRRIVGSERIGYRLEPGQSIAGPRGAAEEINAAGYRDRDWRLAPRASLRVVVLGDTAAYSPGVSLERSWPRLLEQRLREAGHDAIVYRLAVPGYAVDQMVAAYEDDGRALEPQLVIAEIAPSSVRPMRVLHEPEHFPLEGLLRNSALWDWIRRRWLVWPAGEGKPAERRVLADPYDPRNAALWDQARARLEGLRVELDGRGARLVVLAAPRLEAALDPAREDTRWRDWAAARGPVWISPAEELHAAMLPLIEEVRAAGLDVERVWNRDTDVVHATPVRLDRACFVPVDPMHLDERGHEAVERALWPLLEPLLATSGVTPR